MDTLPRVKSVAASKKGWALDVVWADNRKSRVDLTGLIHRSKHFRVFVDDLKAFQKVAPVNYGSSIGGKMVSTKAQLRFKRLQKSNVASKAEV